MPQVWGYRADGAAEIFDLKDGEALPSGWKDTPAAFDEPIIENALVVQPVAVEDAPKRRGRPPKVRDAA